MMERVRDKQENLFENGSRWLRADFHLHTRAGKECMCTQGSEHDFATLFVNQLVKNQIGIGVITNYSKFDNDEYMAIRQQARWQNIMILPGTEVSVNDGTNSIHCLIIFDDTTWLINEENYINQFLTEVFEDATNSEKENARRHYSLEVVSDKLDKHRKQGRDSFIMMAHAEQKGQEKNTYIKIGAFSFSALKYAFFDKEHRVRDNKQQGAHAYIKSIHFIGGKLDGENIPLSSELNTLIGIRGSGKSSILEILRYTLGIPRGVSVADMNYKNNLITYVLGSGGKAIVNIVDKYGREFRIEKIYGQKERIYENDTNRLCDCSVDAIFDLPIYFGQKELSNKTEYFEAELLERLIGNKLQNISREIDAKKREINDTITEIQKSLCLDDVKEDTERTIKDTEQQLLYFKEKGVEEKLKLQTQFEQDTNVLIQSRAMFSSYVCDMAECLEKYESFFAAPVTASSGMTKKICETCNNILHDAKVGFTEIVEINEKNKARLQQFDTALKRLDGQRKELAEDFAKIKREINSDILNPDTFLALTRVVTISKMKLQEIKKHTDKRAALKTKLLNELHELNALWLKEYNLLKDEIKRINESNDKLKIVIEFKETKQHFIDEMKSTFRGTGIRETIYKKVADNFKDFIEIYENDEKASHVLGSHKVVFDEYFNNNLSRLLTFRVKDTVTIDYKGKPLSSYSLGQRASALILFLLAQKDNDVLIIDQPEDDLDNQTIYDEVIKEILKLKDGMQFIFATHNANIPVLGDSEQVISCSFNTDSAISLKIGTIDTSRIQKMIVDIMEGGEEAFNKRKYIYNVWK